MSSYHAKKQCRLHMLQSATRCQPVFSDEQNAYQKAFSIVVEHESTMSDINISSSPSNKLLPIKCKCYHAGLSFRFLTMSLIICVSSRQQQARATTLDSADRSESLRSIRTHRKLYVSLAFWNSTIVESGWMIYTGSSPVRHWLTT